MAEEKSGARSQSLLSGAFILVVATVLVKVIGALFKIPLSKSSSFKALNWCILKFTIFKKHHLF